jgi:hypothetical protein
MGVPKLAILFLSAPVMIWAADPFVGTWKLNVSKSNYVAGTPPKEQTVTISDSGANQDTAVSLTAADGSSISYHFTVPAKGGTGSAVEGGGFDAVTAKRINESTRETHFTQGGKEVRTVRTSVSKDGKTMQAKVKGTDAQGKPVDATLVFEKQ